MSVYEALLSGIPDGVIQDVCIGLNWSAVVVKLGDKLQCGMASTLRGEHEHTGEPTIPGAGSLAGLSALEVATWIKQDHLPTRVSLGMATINALLPRYPETWQSQNVETLLASLGRDRKIALVGHFPFVPHLRKKVLQLDVIDRHPAPGDYPESAAVDILPHADVVAITGMTLLNRTFEGLLRLCKPGATRLLIGPTTPLSTVMFDYGLDILAGSIVTDGDAVLRCVRQGANFRQIKKAGVRLVTVSNPNFSIL